MLSLHPFLGSSFTFIFNYSSKAMEKMQITKSYASQNSQNDESEEVVRFDKSLKELRDLRSQLHYAADYCETTFLNAKQKTMVVENTKEYICRAAVAVVDHLGCVSANLNCRISKTNAFSDAELRINCLKQRLLSCEQYAHKLALTRVRWNANLPKFHRRYLSTPITSVDKSNEDVREPNSPAPAKVADKHVFEAEDLPFFLYTTYTQKSSSAMNLSPRTSFEKGNSNSALALPVRDGLSILSKGLNPTFHFQQCNQKHGRSTLFRKSVHSNDILSLIRRAKRST